MSQVQLNNNACDTLTKKQQEFIDICAKLLSSKTGGYNGVHGGTPTDEKELKIMSDHIQATYCKRNKRPTELLNIRPAFVEPAQTKLQTTPEHRNYSLLPPNVLVMISDYLDEIGKLDKSGKQNPESQQQLNQFLLASKSILETVIVPATIDTVIARAFLFPLSDHINRVRFDILLQDNQLISVDRYLSKTSKDKETYTDLSFYEDANDVDHATIYMCTDGTIYLEDDLKGSFGSEIHTIKNTEEIRYTEFEVGKYQWNMVGYNHVTLMDNTQNIKHTLTEIIKDISDVSKRKELINVVFKQIFYYLVAPYIKPDDVKSMSYSLATTRVNNVDIRYSYDAKSYKLKTNTYTFDHDYKKLIQQIKSQSNPVATHILQPVSDQGFHLQHFNVTVLPTSYVMGRVDTIEKELDKARIANEALIKYEMVQNLNLNTDQKHKIRNNGIGTLSALISSDPVLLPYYEGAINKLKHDNQWFKIPELRKRLQREYIINKLRNLPPPPPPQGGGKPSTVKVKYNGKVRSIHVGPRGAKMIKYKGDWIRLSTIKGKYTSV